MLAAQSEYASNYRSDASLIRAWKNMQYQLLLYHETKPSDCFDSYPCSNTNKESKHATEQSDRIATSQNSFLDFIYDNPTHSGSGSVAPHDDCDTCSLSSRSKTESQSDDSASQYQDAGINFNVKNNEEGSSRLKRKFSESDSSTIKDDEPKTKSAATNIALNRKRNKEYSRTWRSKKKQEAEKLKQEITELRTFRFLIEDSLSIHIHKCSASDTGFPFVYVSPRFAQNLQLSSADKLLGVPLACFVHPSDWIRFEEKLILASLLKTPIEVMYRFQCPTLGQYRLASSTLRCRNDEITVLTRFL